MTIKFDTAFISQAHIYATFFDLVSSTSDLHCLRPTVTVYGIRFTGLMAVMVDGCKLYIQEGQGPSSAYLTDDGVLWKFIRPRAF